MTSHAATHFQLSLGHCPLRARIVLRCADGIANKAVAEELGEACLAVQADIAEAADRERLVAAAVEHGGGLGALVNNAGNMYRVPVTELDEQKLKDIFQVNVIAGMMLLGFLIRTFNTYLGGYVVVGAVYCGIGMALLTASRVYWETKPETPVEKTS